MKRISLVALAVGLSVSCVILQRLSGQDQLQFWAGEMTVLLALALFRRRGYVL